MRADIWLCALVGVANASMMERRGEDYDTDTTSYEGYPTKPYHAKPTGYPAKHDDYKEDYPAKHDDYKEDYPAKHDDYKQDYSSKDDDYKQDYPSKPDNEYEDDDDTEHYAYDAAKKGYPTKPYDRTDSEPWRPKTNHPEFFSIRVDEKCDVGEDPATTCRFDNFAIRLEQGIVIATPYNKWWDPKLPIFFVDDDTELYTVSKKPLQIYVDSVTGALRYAPVGWLPPNAIAFSFYKTGNNPLGNVDPSPAHLSWPSTQGNTLFGAGPWNLCALGNTGQFQVFVSSENYQASTPSGIFKDVAECYRKSLAAINASPWRNGGY